MSTIAAFSWLRCDSSNIRCSLRKPLSTIAAGCGLALDADALYTGAAALIAAVCYVWSWWSNNNVTQAAQAAQKYLDSIKHE